MGWRVEKPVMAFRNNKIIIRMLHIHFTAPTVVVPFAKLFRIVLLLMPPQGDEQTPGKLFETPRGEIKSRK